MNHTEIKLDGRYITTKEFQKRMGWKHLRTVYYALEQGRVTGAIQVGRAWLIPADAVAVDNRVTKNIHHNKS